MSQIKHAQPPSSASVGFFQTPPALTSSFEDDETLRRVFKFYLPQPTQQSIAPDLSRFSKLVLSPKVRNWCADAERNVPYVKHYDSFGQRIDELITTSGWQELQKLGIVEGIVAIGHDRTHQQYARLYQFLKYHIWSSNNACVTCPSAMTDGAARLLKLQLLKADLGKEERKVFEKAHRRLTSTDVETAWTSGQWMTERPGGSDIQNTETQASAIPRGRSGNDDELDADNNPLGPISISGFKWFSSATDANTTVLLAKEPDGGVSAFFAPTRRVVDSSQPGAETQLNGIQIQRLKSKLGTRALPTAELTLSDMRGWRIGKPGQGVREISTVLNITRLHNSIAAVGYLGRGLAVSRAFSKVRRVRNKLLMDTPVHAHTMAELHVEYRAMMHLAYYAAALLGISECPPEKDSAELSLLESVRSALPKTTSHLLRLITPLAKALTARAAIAGLAECMESLGGVGYLENDDPALNIARIFRDANVLSIWEGTTNIMADDVLRIVKGPTEPAVLAAVDELVTPAVTRWQSLGHGNWAQAVQSAWSAIREGIETRNREELALNGRTLSKDLGWLICSVLLAEDALSDGDEVAAEVCTRWINTRVQGSGFGVKLSERHAALDRAIVFGSDLADDRAKL
ncbi:Putative adaptive response protein AidB [Septoria linicola]|uniref:Adaptive response protein AidB n=1 Tax=Septoria linicola TaxID=215465 RepID=A0A9Q9EJS1_9PEZI|nr:putative adaptive response protein AidB [Septoria linicola]USW52487.1 Putative adaptive response protein AidB [Septoria linicola]